MAADSGDLDGWAALDAVFDTAQAIVAIVVNAINVFLVDFFPNVRRWVELRSRTETSVV